MKRNQRTTQVSGWVAGLAVFSAALAGCGHSPSFDVLGSFFPGWILAVLVGVGATLCIHLLFEKLDWERSLAALPLFYLSMTVLVSSFVWLIVFD
jgi:hypothetical protein